MFVFNFRIRQHLSQLFLFAFSLMVAPKRSFVKLQGSLDGKVLETKTNHMQKRRIYQGTFRKIE